MSVYCGAIECKYNGKRNQCTAPKIELSSHSVMTAWDGRQEFWKCKGFELSDEAKAIQAYIQRWEEEKNDEHADVTMR